MPRTSGAAVAALSLAVGVVLADSAIVTLALPDILRGLGAEVGDVVWVLTGFNLVLALVAVPAAWLCTRGGAGWAGAVGLVAFAAASAACALAGSLEVLIGARVAQAIGGALVIAACLELLVAATGDERRGAGRWVAAGVAGAAVGPVVGGLLTEAISWQSIFAVQVPLVLLALPAALRLRTAGARHDGPGDRPDVAANLALAFVSAALTAALFLLVLLLVEGWRRTPALAAVTVTAIPLAAVAAGPLARWLAAGTRAEAVAGSLLVAAGLTGLALLPAAEPLWTVPAQLLVGLGLGLTVDSLTRSALADRVPRALHGGWTIAARHGGIVVGLVLLTPIFTSDLADAERPAREAIAAQVLDAQLPARTKLQLADALGAQLTAETGRVPDLGAAFERVSFPADQAAEAAALQRDLDDQLERAATRAFRTAFLAAAALALVALLPALFLRTRGAAAHAGRSGAGGPHAVAPAGAGGRAGDERRAGTGPRSGGGRAVALVAIAVVAAGGVLGVQVARGGTDFEPARPADPCQDRQRAGADDLESLAESIVLIGLDDAACTLGVSRERLVLAVPLRRDRDQLAREAGTDPEGLARAIADGLRTGVDDQEAAGNLPRVSTFRPQIADELGVPERLLDLVPDSVVDDLLPTGDVLRAALDNLDVNALLADLGDRGSLEAALRDALVQGAIDRARQPIEDAIPDSLRDLVG